MATRTPTSTPRFPTQTAAGRALDTGILHGYEQTVAGPDGDSYLYPDGSVLAAETNHWQALMGDPANLDAWRMPVLTQTAQGYWTWHGAFWQYIPEGPGWTFAPAPPPTDTPEDTERPHIVPSDWDHPDACVGDEEDYCYVNVAHGTGPKGEGWYVTVSLDCNTGHFTEDLCTDDGPYATQEEALAAGQDAARSWCCDNDVYCDDDDNRLEDIDVGSHVWVKPDRRSMHDAVRATILAWDRDNHAATVRYDEPVPPEADEDISIDLVRGIDFDQTLPWRDQPTNQ